MLSDEAILNLIWQDDDDEIREELNMLRRKAKGRNVTSTNEAGNAWTSDLFPDLPMKKKIELWMYAAECRGLVETPFYRKKTETVLPYGSRRYRTFRS